MSDTPGWVHPLSVDPDEREAVTAANFAAIERYRERVAADRQRWDAK